MEGIKIVSIELAGVEQFVKLMSEYERACKQIRQRWILESSHEWNFEEETRDD